MSLRPVTLLKSHALMGEWDWNTFDTHGICPKCSWQWIITACLSCKQFSPHEEWYHEPIDESDGAREEKQVLEEA
jgi:hypothetical protein